MREIAEQAQLLAFLQDYEIFACKATNGLTIKYFDGGVSGTVAFVTDGKRDVIVKQALATLKVSDVWECDPSRMRVEYDALKVYEKIVPQSVPKPVCYDAENYIMVRQAAPEDCLMWKQLLLGGVLDFNIARQAITSIAAIHNGTAGDASVKDLFIENKFFYDLRINPYITRVAELYPEIAPKARQVIDFLMNRNIALIHGDYSPKNILVNDGRIFILDLEVAYYGNPAFDLGFFFALFMLKAVKNKMWADAYINMLIYMSKLYLSNVTFMDANELEAQSVQTTAFILLARIDGKSPAEYITSEKDKQIARKAAFKLIQSQSATFSEMCKIMQDEIKNTL